jgi:hypothetical protein
MTSGQVSEANDPVAMELVVEENGLVWRSGA